jgi:hypothetical protein
MFVNISTLRQLGQLLAYYALLEPCIDGLPWDEDVCFKPIYSNSKDNKNNFMNVFLNEK